MTDATADIETDNGISPATLRLLAGALSCIVLAAAIAIFEQFIIADFDTALKASRAFNGSKFASGFLEACGNPCVIRDNPGGFLLDFKGLAAEVNARKTVILIDGDCVSACALFADLARANIRITRRAKFWFHQTSAEDAPPHSPDIAAWVNAHGGFPAFEAHRLTKMEFEDARRFFRPVFDWQRVPVNVNAPWRWPTFLNGIDVPIEMRGTVR